jgi:hypothetical protein
MRSGSSLLTHLIASSKEVYAYGETHTTYHCDESFNDLICKIRLTLKALIGFKDRKIYLDKVLHNSLLRIDNISLIKDMNAKIIFLLRSPKDTVNSLIKTFSMEPEKAFNYYNHRLNYLNDLTSLTDSYPHTYYLNYEDLVEKTDDQLHALTSYLKLKEKINNYYKMLPKAGKGGVGDIGKNIFKGVVIKMPSAENYIGINEKSQTIIESKYIALKKRLKQQCYTEADFL